MSKSDDQTIFRPDPTYRPVSHAERCPVCGGSGDIIDGQSSNSFAPCVQPCNGCGGLGWVTVKDF